jgi:twitching motility two-component system response regulator PilH
MPGESILIIEDSSAERDIAQRVLHDAGYNVITAANAAAAMTYPELQDINLIVMDSALDGVSGVETTRMLRQQPDTHPTPVLLLIPDEEVKEREDLSARGANGYLLKPYDGRSLTRKVAALIEQQHLDDLSRQYLTDAADSLMQELAREHIKKAVDRKTQLIIERCIQNVATAVDDRAREEVDKRVTGLTAEKEQELVKHTVREVSQSMIEKLAERKVNEAMEQVFASEADRTVRRIADNMLPSMLRDRLKESCNNLLPREIQIRLQKAAEKMIPELSQEMVSTVEAVASKAVPRVARDVLPGIGERQIKVALSEQIPRLVTDLVNRELESQLYDKLDPAIRSSVRSLRRIILVWNAVLSGLVVVGVAAAIAMALLAR